MQKPHSHRSAFFLLLFTALIAVESRAQSFCFLSAATYYQQVYCELQAKGETRGLPPFHQFKRNDETIQAVLLKRPAARLGIDLPSPKKNSQKPVMSEARILPASDIAAQASALPGSAETVVHSLAECALDEDDIICADGVSYQLTGNRLNHRLAAAALTADNQMALPVFAGSLADSLAVNRYLADAYRRYIEKMHEIGLAGATMTYGKFSFLFFDLHEKGLNFSQRFETMYDFLKKDKASMGVTEKISLDNQLRLDNCDPLSGQMLVCSSAGRNYLFLLVSD